MSRTPILVIGASGFVGRWAVSELRKRGVEAMGVARRPSGDDAAIIACDLADRASVESVFAKFKPKTVLHLAWTTKHGQFWSTPDNLDWIATTLQLARIAADAGVTRFVGVGTCVEYDVSHAGPCVEGETLLAPTTLYGVAKDATRRVLQKFAETDLSFAWGRLFYLYGPHEDPRRLVASVAKRLAAGEPAPISGGLAVRDFLDVRDAGAALAALALSDVEGAVNIASGQGVSVRALAECLAVIAGKPELVQVGVLPDRDEPPRIVASIGRLRDEVGFSPSRDLERGLAECYAWWREQGAASGPARGSMRAFQSL